MDDNVDDSVKLEATEVQNTENEVKPTDETKEKRSGKEEKGKKKDDRRPAEQYLRSLNDVRTVEDRLGALCKKYSEVVEENRKLQLTVKRADKKTHVLQKEKEQFQAEQSKAALTRRRLENLCRELQKQNKVMKDETLLKIREQEEMRQKLTEKFQGGFSQIQAFMNEYVERNAKLYEENLASKKNFDAITKQLLDIQTGVPQLKAQLQATNVELIKAEFDKEMLMKEKEELLLKMTEYQAQIMEQRATEEGLRSQITMYNDKYDEFQNALTRNNEVYGEFTEEMKQMSKKILMLEKETNLWKQQWEASQASLREMKANKKQKDSEIATLNKKLSLLQDLCKQFQCERMGLSAKLKEENGNSKNSAHRSKDNAKYGRHGEKSSSKASDSSHRKSRREDAEKAAESARYKQERNSKAENKETAKLERKKEVAKQGSDGKVAELNKETNDSGKSLKVTNSVEVEGDKAETKLEVLADETEIVNTETKSVEFCTEECSLSKSENATGESVASEENNGIDSKLESSPLKSTNVPNVTAVSITPFSRLDNESEGKECKEDICSSKERVENVCGSTQAEHVCSSKEQEEATCSSKEEVETVCSNKDQEENVCGGKEEVGNGSSSKEQEESVCTNKEEEESVCSEKQKECVYPSGKEDESVCTKEEQEENVCTSNEQDERVCTSKEQEESVCTSKEQEESVCTSKEQEESVCTSKEKEEESVPPSKEQEESVCTSKNEEESVCISEEQDESVCTNKEKEEESVPPSKEQEESVPPSKEQEESVCISKEQDESVPPSKEQEETVCISKEQDESVCISEEQDETVCTNKEEEEESVSTITEQEESVSTNKEQQESARTNKEDTPNTCNNTEQEINEELVPNVKSLCNDVESLHSDTKCMINQLHKALDSVNEDNAKDLGERSCTSETQNEVIEDKDLTKHVEELVVEKTNAATESPATTLGSNDKPVEINKSLTKSDGNETKSGKPASAKNGRRRKR